MSEHKLSNAFADALKPGKIIFKLVMFFVFGFLTAVSYIIYNIDQVWNNVTNDGGTKMSFILAYLGALTKAMWIGIGIGLSTLWNTLINLGTTLSSHHYGTLIYSVIVLGLVSVMVYQVVSFILDATDKQMGRGYSMLTGVAISIGLTLLVFAPISHAILDGQTITSGVENNAELDLLDELLNNTIEPDLNEEIAGINLLDNEVNENENETG